MDGTGAAAAIRLEAVGKTYADGTVAVRRAHPGCGAGRGVRAGRPVRVRQDDDAEDGQPAHRADQRADPARRRGRHPRRPGGPAAADGIRHPARRPLPPPHGRARTSPRCPSCSAGTARGCAPAPAELLDLVGLDPEVYAGRYPQSLSGGQRQRVGVARALAADPPVLLMDEPFGAVDPLARDRLQQEFLRLQRAIGKTVVLVTHDVEEAVRLGDRIAVLSEGGRLEQHATPAEVLGSPASEVVAGFVGGDRGIKRLAVTPIEAADLEPPRAEAGRPAGAGRPRRHPARRARGPAPHWTRLGGRRRPGERSGRGQPHRRRGARGRPSRGVLGRLGRRRA